MPRCVEACPHEAILFGEEGAFQNENSEILKPEYKANPRVMWRELPAPWISGAVIDGELDEIIMNAVVKVRSREDENSCQAHTDEFGDFYVRNLAANRSYNIEISAEGYNSFTREILIDSDLDLGTVVLNRQ